MSRVTLWSADESCYSGYRSCRALFENFGCRRYLLSGFVIVVVIVEAVPSGNGGVGGGDVGAFGALFPGSECGVGSGLSTSV
jgi:hypothetical protein